LSSTPPHRLTKFFTFIFEYLVHKPVYKAVMAPAEPPEMVTSFVSNLYFFALSFIHFKAKTASSPAIAMARCNPALNFPDAGSPLDIFALQLAPLILLCLRYNL